MNSQSIALQCNTNALGIQKLTNRELEVLELISYGFSTKEIGEKLYLAQATIETHRYNLFSKFDCKNMAQLVRMGFEIGFLSLSR